jgi:hypothetical protein
LAGSSTAPGSPVTYSPWMPSFPAALVMSMIELSTVAGAFSTHSATLDQAAECHRLGSAQDVDPNGFADLVLG